jgi:hypothetical protein
MTMMNMTRTTTNGNIDESDDGDDLGEARTGSEWMPKQADGCVFLESAPPQRKACTHDNDDDNDDVNDNNNSDNNNDDDNDIDVNDNNNNDDDDDNNDDDNDDNNDNDIDVNDNNNNDDDDDENIDVNDNIDNNDDNNDDDDNDIDDGERTLLPQRVPKRAQPLHSGCRVAPHGSHTTRTQSIGKRGETT